MNGIQKRLGKALANVWPLYAGTFAMAISLSVLWTAMPFIIRNIGGTEAHVGYVLAANMIGYVLSLLLLAPRLADLNPRHASRISAAVVTITTSLMIATVYRALAPARHASPLHIWTVIAAGTVAGASMSLFWPFLMSWLSADYEGPELNRRLGTYNGMWSGAAIVGPIIGAALVDANTLSPIALSAAAVALSFALLCLAHDRSVTTAAETADPDTPKICFDRIELLRFKWTARIALFCAWLCFAVARSQFALLFTSFGYSETTFGVIMTVFCICNFAAVTGAGHSSFWHFRPAYTFAAQILMAGSLALMILGRSLPPFAIAFLLFGPAFGFAYASHLYYGACGAKKRSTQMTIHEVTISLGVIVGSTAGGILAKRVGPYAPYYFAITIITLGLAAQLIISQTLKPRNPAAS